MDKEKIAKFLTKLARDTIVYYLKTGKIYDTEIPEDVKDYVSKKRACFVTLHLKDGTLRGCIGTILPYYPTLKDEVIHNAISAATRDPRFYPVHLSEMDNIEISVDVLTEPQLVKDISELDPKRYGIILKGNGKSGVLLPDLEGVDTVQEQIAITKAKAGLSDNEPYEIYKFEVERFHEVKD